MDLDQVVDDMRNYQRARKHIAHFTNLRDYHNSMHRHARAREADSKRLEQQDILNSIAGRLPGPAVRMLHSGASHYTDRQIKARLLMDMFEIRKPQQW